MKKIIYNVLTILFFTSVTMFAQSRSIQHANMLMNAFDQAAIKYNVPSDLLKSISYSETRFSNIIETNKDHSPDQQPPVYGIMGLRNDDWFGHSLVEGSKLIGANPDDVAVNESLNIQAAAALLSSIADSLKTDRSNLNNWRPVLEKFSGIPQTDVKPFYSYGVFDALSKGETVQGITIYSHAQVQMNQFGPEVNPKSSKKKLKSVESVQSADYPPAVWEPSPNFTPGNIQQLFLVVHDTEGPFAGSVSWLRNGTTNGNSSAHYVIRSSDGFIVQLVREHDEAWHVLCWNHFMVGVEHEGYVSQPKYFTEAMYKSSAALFRHLALTYHVPVDSNRIIGHYQWTKTWWVNWVNNTWNPSHPSASFNPLCNTHTDPGPYWNWHHFFDLINQGAVKPNVTSYTPGLSDSVWSTAAISITFDQSMSPEVTQSAIHFAPAITGNFKWTNSNKTVTFTPSSLLTPGIKYTVSIDSSAVSIFNASIDTSIAFGFYTKPASPLSVVKAYPQNNQGDISPTVKVIIGFNAPLIFSSLGGGVMFQDSAGMSVGLQNAQYYESGDKGFISFTSSKKLNYNSTYKIIIKSKVQSANTSTLANDFVASFKTGGDNFVQGTVVENFESMDGWQQPSPNSGSAGIDTNSSKFVLEYNTPPEGSYSGKLTYSFTGSSGGICKLINTNKPSLGSTQRDNFGIWIYGDLSYNIVGCSFSVNGAQDKDIIVDTLNWTGWKFEKIPFDEIASSGEILFSGIYIQQGITGSDSNVVYFDGAQYNDPQSTGVSNGNNKSEPSAFTLAQNYPNPFNPSTVIQYQIPKNEFVTLKIYDLLGKEVATLISGQKDAGSYQVEFNADNLPNKITSGIYFYTLKAGNFSQTKKLVLMK